MDNLPVKPEDQNNLVYSRWYISNKQGKVVLEKMYTSKTAKEIIDLRILVKSQMRVRLAN